MKLSVLFERASLAYPPALGDMEIKNIVADSRRVEQGSLYVCIRGLHTDGHEKIGEAITKGAAVIVAEPVRDVFVGGAAAIYVENTRSVLARLYHAWYENPADRMTVVGITGTNGKTSVAWMLSRLFTTLGFRCGLIGTIRCESAGRVIDVKSSNTLANMTTPDPEQLYKMLAEMAQDGVTHVFMEVTSHALSLGKCDAIAFDTAVFTNLTQDHLDFHGSMENYFHAKEKLFSMCRRAVVCIDDEAGERIYQKMRHNAVSCSQMRVADYMATNIEYNESDGCRYAWQTPQGIYPLFVPLAGKFSIINSLEAAAVACELGISAERVSLALSKMEPVPGRMEQVRTENNHGIQVLIDYAHTPDALRKLLQSLDQGKGRVTLVFGCGGERDRSKRCEMAQVASRMADFVVITSDNSRSEPPEQIFRDIMRGIDKEKPHILIPDRREAIRYAIANAKPGDRVVLAGKGHERYEITADGRHPFDERIIAAQALREFFPRT